MSRLRADDLPNCLQDLEAGSVDFVIAYESRRASSIASTADIDSVRIGYDTLIPVSKMGPDGRPMFDLDRKSAMAIPYLRFGSTAPISQHIMPLLDASDLHARLQVVYENSMGGALRIRVRDGTGLAWLPKSLVSPDLDAHLVALAGGRRWHIALDIRLYRIRRHTNTLTNKIWDFLKGREDRPLLAEGDAMSPAADKAKPAKQVKAGPPRKRR